MQYIIIDIGNTRSKIGLFTAQALSTTIITETPRLQEKITQILSSNPSDTPITIAYISTAKELNLENEWHQLHTTTPKIKFIKIDVHFPFPLNNHYATPLTLGTDRIVGIIAARKQAKDKPVLVIDIGTAITYDFADAQDNYYGGAISLGLRMRFRALNQFTARLPLITDLKHVPLVGNTTQNSILSGVINGTIAEITATIQAYYKTYSPDINIFLTGGDATFLAQKIQEIPYTIDETLVLKGIFALVAS